MKVKCTESLVAVSTPLSPDLKLLQHILIQSPPSCVGWGFWWGEYYFKLTPLAAVPTCTVFLL